MDIDSIKEITNKLFKVNYKIDSKDSKKINEYREIAKKLIEDNLWDDVFSCWYDYLLSNCKKEDEILNFAKLFWCYGGQKYYIPNAVEFCAFFYVSISFEHYPWASPVIDGIAWEVLVRAGIIDERKLTFDNYTPDDIPLMVAAIEKWRGKGYGFH